MLSFVGGSVTCASILNLQEVRFCKVHAPSIQIIPVLLFISLADYEVDVVASDGAVVGQRVLDQRIGNSTGALRQTLVTLVEIDTVALDPC